MKYVQITDGKRKKSLQSVRDETTHVSLFPPFAHIRLPKVALVRHSGLCVDPVVICGSNSYGSSNHGQ